MANYGWLSAEMEYTLQEEIGVGKMTRVHRAVDDNTGEILAVKVFNRLPLVSEDAKRRVFLREEAAILAMVKHGVSRAITVLCPEMLPLLTNIVLSLIFSIAGRCGIWIIHL